MKNQQESQSNKEDQDQQRDRAQESRNQHGDFTAPSLLLQESFQGDFHHPINNMKSRRKYVLDILQEALDLVEEEPLVVFNENTALTTTTTGTPCSGDRSFCDGEEHEE